MRSLRSIFLLTFSIFAAPAFGQSSCWQTENAIVEAFVSPAVVGGQFSELFSARMQLAGGITSIADDSAVLAIQLSFDPAFDGVSLPFTVFAITALVDGQQVVVRDFTNGCTGSGVSFYPGTILAAGKTRLPLDRSSALRFTIWGGL